MDIIIVINAGSSSIKFQVFNYNNLEKVASGLLERLYIDGNFEMKIKDKQISQKVKLDNHEIAINFLIQQLKKYKLLINVQNLKGIGHRIVHGGEIFKEASIIEKNEIEELKNLIILAPLHNPGAISVIQAFKQLAPDVINVADFDTAFHSTIPVENSTYAIPEKWRKEYHVKRYGMHGISYEYITQQMSKALKKPIDKINLIIAHLGNGASICAIKNGKSFNTSMGLTPLAGLIMGTRSGDIDPAIPNYIAIRSGKSIAQVTQMLNNESGIKALSGHIDMRDLQEDIEKGSTKSKLAIKIWAKQINNYISMYYNQLETKIDALVFTAGIGENGVLPREEIFKQLHIIDSHLCMKKNKMPYTDINLISNDSSSVPSFTLRTNEEFLIAIKVKKHLK